MVTAIILINTERTKINDVAEQLAEMAGVSEVYSVSGKYDLIVIVRVGSNDDLADLVTKKMLRIDAIVNSETMLAFKAFSRLARWTRTCQNATDTRDDVRLTTCRQELGLIVTRGAFRDEVKGESTALARSEPVWPSGKALGW